MELRSLPDGPVVEDGGADDGATGVGEAPEPEGAGAGAASSWPGRLAGAALVAALVPLVVAAVRAIATGWVPVGDSALIAIRSRDVLGGGPLRLRRLADPGRPVVRAAVLDYGPVRQAPQLHWRTTLVPCERH